MLERCLDGLPVGEHHREYYNDPAAMKAWLDDAPLLSRA